MKTIQWLSLLFILSCAKPSYYQTNKKALDAYYQNNYTQALNEIEKNKYLCADYNKLLYLLEKGRLLYLQGNYEAASQLFIEAEQAQEDWNSFFYRDINGHKTYLMDNRYTRDGTPLPPPPKNMDEAMDQGAAGVRGSYGSASTITFTPPHKTVYACADFERPLVNYYIGLCGLQKLDDNPIIEAKRLELLMQQLDTRKFPPMPGNYSSNPFIYMCQGIFYESKGELNDAFIAYEHALKAFEDPACIINYGLSLPQQLKQDLLDLSKQLGFMDKYSSYAKRFNQAQQDLPLNSSLVLLIEKQHVPHKDSKLLWLVPGQPEPFEQNPHTAAWVKINKVFVAPSAQPVNEVSVEAAGQTYLPAPINNLEYMMMEATRTRIATEQRINTGAGANKQLTAVHNYDTRNWQTLPAAIDYVRIPLGKGMHELKIRYQLNGKWVEQPVQVNIQQSRQVMMVRVIAGS